MKKLIIRPKSLPAAPEELQKFILVGKEKLKMYRVKVEAIDRLGLSKAVRDQALEDSQRMAIALLYAEAKMGELLSAEEHRGGSSTKGTSHPLPKGINKKQSHQAQKLYKAKDYIEEVVAEAVKNERIPSRSDVIDKARENERKERDARLKPSPLPEGVYDVIYADPPWRYEDCPCPENEIENHYPTMELEDMQNLKLPIADNAVLFLWSTAPMLENAISVMNSWGFRYRTCAAWDKESFGMGYWFRIGHELLLVGVKGKFKAPDPKVRVSSVYREKRTMHSKKPEYYYEVIEKYFPGHRYLEAFARNTRKGWAPWGNEV